ncbi:MAG TPA: ribbon-helix-helix protein, CopG family [Vicinamibacterales bacterium]|jgi:predicted DNA-binding protein|nr:ribbon-helix-helix protein, CopG family [Vicinamibacterales bacterium]
MAKLTFSLDDETVAALKKAAERSRKPQSLIVREAIAEYTSRDERLAPEERERLIGVLRRIKSRPRGGSQADVDRELREVRRSRREGWSRPAR